MEKGNSHLGARISYIFFKLLLTVIQLWFVWLNSSMTIAFEENYHQH